MTVTSILQCSSVTCRQEICLITGRTNHENFLHLFIYGVLYNRVNVPSNSRTFNLNFQDFPAPKSFSRTFQDLEILQTKIQDFPGGVGTLDTKETVLNEQYLPQQELLRDRRPHTSAQTNYSHNTQNCIISDIF